MSIKSVNQGERDVYETGTCLIFNMEFQNGERHRQGAEQDPHDLRNKFEKFNMEVEVLNDYEESLNREKILEKIQESLEPNKLLVCCILSHGFDGGVYDAEGTPLPLEDILSEVEKKKERGPVVFFIAACQLKGEKKSCSLWDVEVPRNTIISVAATPGEQAVRTLEGTTYVQKLCRAFKMQTENIVSLFRVLEDLNHSMEKDQQPFEVKNRGDLYFKTISVWV